MSPRGAQPVCDLSPDAVESYASLLVALDRLTELGQTTPCQEPTRQMWWTSDDDDEREAATHACGRCPLLDICASTTQHEPAHVWGGIDRTPIDPRRAA